LPLQSGAYPVPWRLCVLAIVSAACTSPTPPPASPDAQAVCPSSVSETAGAACTVQGLVCAPQYACGVTFGIAHCVCVAGAFECTDLTDASISGTDVAPSCPKAKPAEHCPATESAASLAACTEPGLVCSYKAPCSAIPGLDQCTCFNGAMANGQTGLRFECTNACVPSGGALLIDSGDDVQEGAGGPADAVAPDDALDGGASLQDADASG
jgi:hypothetical protein